MTNKFINIQSLFIALFFIINLVFISSFELTYDEAYYWFYSNNLSFGYYDHPPMVAWIIKLGTSIFGNNEFGVRIGFNILFAFGLYLISKLWNQAEQKSFLAIMLSLPLLSFSGLFALPDTPLLFFGVLFFYTYKNFLKKSSLPNIIALALAITGMFYSKYHGLLVVVLTLLSNIKLLKKKEAWIVFLLVIISYIPHLHWQYNHDFVSFKFHLTGRKEKHFELLNIFNNIFSQIALSGFFFGIYAFTKIIKNKWSDQFEKTLYFNSIGFFIFIFFMSFRNQIEANWTVTAVIALALLSSYKAPLSKNKFVFYSLCLPILLTFCLRGVIIMPQYTIDKMGGGENRLNEISGWKEGRIEKIRKICAENTIIADNYQYASKVSFYLKKNISALHLGSRSSHYEFINGQKKIKPDDKICYLTTKNILNATRVETNYKDPVYIVHTTLDLLAKHYRITYEEIIRSNR